MENIHITTTFELPTVKVVANMLATKYRFVSGGLNVVVMCVLSTNTWHLKYRSDDGRTTGEANSWRLKVGMAGFKYTEQHHRRQQTMSVMQSRINNVEV